jgi:O-antigen ligase
MPSLFEILLILYLFAGRYKADPRFEWVPVDLTALFWGLSVVAGLFVLWRQRFKVHRKSVLLVWLVLGFVGYAVVSLAWTPSRVYARQKVFYIATLTLWPLIACALIIAYDRRRLRRFLALLVVFSGWIAGESTLELLRSGGQGFIHALGGGYLGSGRVVGLGLLVVLGYGLFFEQKKLEKLGAVILIGWFLLVLLVLGGRAPLLATGAAALVPLSTGFRPVPSGKLAVQRSVVPLLVLIVLVVVIVVCLYSSGTMTTTLRRLNILFSEGMESATQRRVELYIDAIRFWSEMPLLGHGIGAFPLLEGREDVRLYPHNLILEILVELGLVGLTLFGISVFSALKALGTLKTVRDDPWRLIVLMLFVNTFMNSMATGDISDNRIVFGVLGLMTLSGKGSVQNG